MNSNRQAVAGKDGYFELSETIKAFVDHTCLWNFLYDLVYADGAEQCKNTYDSVSYTHLTLPTN